MLDLKKMSVISWLILYKAHNNFARFISFTDLPETDSVIVFSELLYFSKLRTLNGKMKWLGAKGAVKSVIIKTNVKNRTYDNTKKYGLRSRSNIYAFIEHILYLICVYAAPILVKKYDLLWSIITIILPEVQHKCYKVK